ncbi:MAG TPA: SGNH/GDSL hydrolase family protein [Candidatus Hydrogenedentes bacterium]|nr:SGNH/GDSL hydrolase family protein [Candidatus Hydrogenedentota bacterium]
MWLFALTLAGVILAVDDDAIIERSLVSMGDTARLHAVMQKAKKGKPVTVAVLGGSITQGAMASKEEYRYGNRVAQWWRDTFPKSDITFVNAGIGATGSDIGAHRLKEHLLSKKPDFVVVEYGVNDLINPKFAETLEGVLRQILKQKNHPAVALLFMMDQAGNNVQEMQQPIGAHYSLPMVSFRDALWPEIQAGRIAWNDIEADAVHPNDRGHEYAAKFIIHVLQEAADTFPDGGKHKKIAALPAPKTANAFECTSMLNANSLKPVQNNGWETFADPDFNQYFGAGWKSSTPGSTLEFKVKGRVISVLFFRIKGAMGIAEAHVDDGPPIKMDAWFDQTWGGYTPLQLVACDLTPGKHRLKIRLLEEKNPNSEGYEFRIHAIMTAGVKNRD